MGDDAKGAARWAAPAGDGKDHDKDKEKKASGKAPDSVKKFRAPDILFSYAISARPAAIAKVKELENNENKPSADRNMERQVLKHPQIPDLKSQLKAAEVDHFQKLQYYVVTGQKDKLEKENAFEVDVARYTQMGFSKPGVLLALAMNGFGTNASEKLIVDFCTKYDKEGGKKKAKDAFCNVILQGIEKARSDDALGVPIQSLAVRDKKDEKPAGKVHLASGQLQLQVVGVMHDGKGAHTSHGAKLDAPQPRYGHGYVSMYPGPHKVLAHNAVDLRRYNHGAGADFKRYGL